MLDSNKGDTISMSIEPKTKFLELFKINESQYKIIINPTKLHQSDIKTQAMNIILKDSAENTKKYFLNLIIYE